MPEPSLKEGRDVAGEEGESSPSVFVTLEVTNRGCYGLNTRVPTSPTKSNGV